LRAATRSAAVAPAGDPRAQVDRACDADAKTRVAYRDYSTRNLRMVLRASSNITASACLMSCEQPQ